MAPHFTRTEMDMMKTLSAQGRTVAEIQTKLHAQRVRRAKAGSKANRKIKTKGLGPDLTSVRRFLKGVTHRHSPVETRGRKRKLSAGQLQKVEKVRKQLYKKAQGEEEVHWDQILAKSGVKDVDSTTVARNLKKAGYDVAARAPREKPSRTTEHNQQRERVCRGWLRKPKNYFTKKVHLIIDNKMFEIATSSRAKRYMKMRKVRFHIPARSEGLKPGFTKPSAKKKQRINPGASVNVVAGIAKGRIRLWHYLPKGKKWCGKLAADTYSGPIQKTLKRVYGKKKQYIIIEDNDPTGYKSSAAKREKKKLRIVTPEWPAYSPDLNPLDFSLWKAVQDRMDRNEPAAETVDAYKRRLRRTALALPESVVTKAVKDIRVRAQMVVEAVGGDIAKD